MQYDMMR